MSYLTPEEVAHRLGVTPKTIREHLRDGRIKGEKNGGRWRIEESEFARHLQSGAVTLERAVYTRLILEVIGNDHILGLIEQGMLLWPEDIQEQSKTIVDAALVAGIVVSGEVGGLKWKFADERRDMHLDELILDWCHEDIATRLIDLHTAGTLKHLRDEAVKSAFDEWFEEQDDDTKSNIINKMTELGYGRADS